MFLSFGYGFGGRSRFGRKKSKPKKAKKENWYERLVIDELKQICRAAKLPVKGTKKDLINRLLEHEPTNQYAWEGLRQCGIGVTVGDLKEMCRTKGLTMSGSKLTLVLRIVEYDHADPETAASLKKRVAASEDPSQPAKKRAKKAPPKPSTAKIYQKVQKKIESVRQKKYQSHWGSKCHSPEVYSCIEKILREDAIDKGYVTSDPLFALDLAKSALTSLTDNFETIERPGYDDYGSISGFCDNLGRIVDAAMPLLGPDNTVETVDWIEALDTKLAPYGLGEDFSDGNRYLDAVLAKLRSDGVSDDADAKDNGGNDESEQKSANQLPVHSMVPS